MIESITKLAFMYVISMLFFEFAFPAGKRFLKYIYWSAVFLAVYIVVAPVASRFFNDIHIAATTYSEGKKAVNNFLGNDNQDSPSVGYLGPLERITGAKWEVPVKGKITQGYVEGQHHGIDVAAKEGTPIKSTRPGRVSKVASDPVYGLMVVLDHGNGYESLYTHCSEVLVKQGDKIFAKDVISKVGSSGNSSGPHLHFEIRINGKTINPMQFLKEE